MAMSADAVIDPAIARKIDGSFSRIYLFFNIGNILHDLLCGEMLLNLFLITVSDCKYFHFPKNHHISTRQETNRSLVCVISGSLISRLLLSSCTSSDTSFFSTILFCRGEAG